MNRSVIVLGSSPESLVSAAYLAKAGVSVILLDPASQPGGRFSCIPDHQCRIPACPLPLSGFEPHMPLGAILAELGASAPVFELHGEYRILAPGMNLDVMLDTDPVSNDALFNSSQSCQELSDAAAAFWASFMLYSPHGRSRFLPADLPDCPSPDISCLPEALAGSVSRANGFHEPDIPLAAALNLEQCQRPLFLPQNSVCSLMHAFGELLRLFNGKLHREQDITSVALDNGVWQVSSSGQEYRAQGLVLGIRPDLAMPLFHGPSAELLQEVPVFAAPTLTIHAECEASYQDLPMHTLLIPAQEAVQGIREFLVTLLDQDLCPDERGIMSIRCSSPELAGPVASGLAQDIAGIASNALFPKSDRNPTIIHTQYQPGSPVPTRPEWGTGFTSEPTLVAPGIWTTPLRRTEGSFLLARQCGMTLAAVLS